MKKVTTLLISLGLTSSLYAADLITEGSLCVGMDCNGPQTFGFDTIRLRENNLRIKFDDTTDANSTFPSNDWQITINDSTNGGLNKFSIDDITHSKVPFLIEANAPTNALYIEDDGDIGIGTSTPVVQLHMKDGNTPTIRLEQDGSSGFTPQVWDIASNEANFFIRDATNGSLLPFRIKPGSPSSSIYIYPTYVEMANDLKVNGSIFTASDKNLKENFNPVNADVVLKKIDTLDISIWNFKDDEDSLRHIGPMAQDFYKIFKVGIDDKHIAPTDMASVALAGVQALSQKLQKKEQEILKLRTEIDKMKLLQEKITALEQLVQNLSAVKSKQ